MIRELRRLENEGGFTLKNGVKISYKTGYQVADYGIETKSVYEAAEAIEKMGGNAGVWFYNGIYYIDHSFRVNTKKEAVTIGKKHNQTSVYAWSRSYDHSSLGKECQYSIGRLGYTSARRER